jgi:hypothetical protein
MSMRVYKLEGGGGAKGAGLAIAIVGIGLLIVGFSLALLLVLGTVGAVIGAGVVLYRRLTGGTMPGIPGARATAQVDPSLEVFAPDAVITDRPVRELPDSPSRD